MNETLQQRDFRWLSKHCDPLKARRETQAPFCIEVGNVVYAAASNGFYLVAVPLLAHESRPFETLDSKVAVTLFGDHAPPKALIAPSELILWIHCAACSNLDVSFPCTKCDGRGKVICKTCDGSMELECICECGHSHQSPCECGTGETQCRDCFGSGSKRCKCLTNTDLAPFAEGLAVDRRFIRAGLAGLRFSLDKRLAASWSPNVARLDAEDWSLLVAPNKRFVGGPRLVMQDASMLDVLASL